MNDSSVTKPHKSFGAVDFLWRLMAQKEDGSPVYYGNANPGLEG